MLEKNVPGWERALRLIASIATIAGGIVLVLAQSWIWGSVVLSSGIVLIATAATGWCPMCAMVGRKLPPSERKITVGKL